MRRDSSGSPQSFLDGGRSIPELDAFPASPGPLLFLPLLFVQAGGMDLSKVGEKLLSSVRSARSLGLLPGPSDRPEVPARAAAAAVVAHALAGLPPHQRINLPSSSDGLVSAYSSRKHGETVEELEEEFYEEEFDPVRYLIETLPSEESDSTYFEKKSTLRLAQLDKILERLSRHVMEHHEKMVKGMQLVMELEQDLKVANVICMNGRRHITSSMNEVSRDLVVHTKSRKKQALLDMLPILAELRHAVDMQTELETLIEKGRYCQAFQLLPEYLQILDNYSGLSAIQEMGRDIEAWLARTIQKLDAHLLGVCQAFNEQSYITAVDAYALMGDIAGLAEKIQSFFMQEVLSQTHSILKDLVQEEIGNSTQRSRLTYSDLCTQIPESKFRQCLLKTLDTLFKLMCSYFSIMIFQSEDKKGLEIKKSHVELMQDGACRGPEDKKLHDSEPSCSSDPVLQNGHAPELSNKTDGSEVLNNKRDTHESGTLGAIHYSSSTSVKASEGESSVLLHDSPFHQLRKDATMFVRHTLEKGRRNMWQLTTSRVSALLSSSAVGSSSTYQFLRNYEDLNTFILAGEGFCGVEAVDFRQKLRSTCESYVASFHHQNVYALKMVLEKESWVKISAETIQITSLAGLIGDGAPLVVPSLSNASISILDPRRYGPIDNDKPNNGFSYWIRAENPFSSKFACEFKESPISQMSPNGLKSSSLADGNVAELSHSDKMSTKDLLDNHLKPSCSAVDDENEDLLADFIDEDSQLPSRVLKPMLGRTKSSSWNDEEASAQTGSSLCLLRLMDKYARLMQKLEIVNLEFFKGMCQLFGIFYYYIFEAFGHQDANQSGKSLPDLLSPRLKMALSKILQDCDQWIRSTNMSYSPSSPISLSPAFAQMEVLPTIPPSTMLGHVPSTSFGLKARCDGVETISLVARVLNRSRAHLQSMLLQHNAGLVEEFYNNLVDTVPDLAEHIHRTTARMLLHINGYADKIANAKWEVKELGLEHNGYVDLLLGEFKHYKTRLVHGGISKEVQDILLEYGLESVAETLTEGLSRVKRCTDEGRVLMSLDLQVLINGLQHFAANVKPKLQIVETFIKAYYLPETEYVHWARSHPEYSRSQIVGLINLVAAMKGWKRKTRVEAIEKIEA